MQSSRPGHVLQQGKICRLPGEEPGSEPDVFLCAPGYPKSISGRFPEKNT
jgi:hypothetical protein